MSRRKPTPETSTITRPRPVAYARKQKPGSDDDKDKDAATATQDTAKAEAPAPAESIDEAPTMPARGRVDTVGIPADLVLGHPPDMPARVETAAAPRAPATAVESPTFMPGPREVPGGNPTDAAPPPGLVPPGDSRSLRREADFALIYRLANAVITRWGAVGTRGQWRVVEYPTTAAASHAYAKECSRFVAEGFSDYRE
jgi:hypothetical protein